MINTFDNVISVSFLNLEDAGTGLIIGPLRYSWKNYAKQVEAGGIFVEIVSVVDEMYIFCSLSKYLGNHSEEVGAK